MARGLAALDAYLFATIQMERQITVSSGLPLRLAEYRSHARVKSRVIFAVLRADLTRDRNLHVQAPSSPVEIQRDAALA